MRLRRRGEDLWTLEELPEGAAARVARALAQQQIPGVLECSPGWETVGIYAPSGQVDADRLLKAVEVVLASPDLGASPILHEIPVCYEFGLDLAAAALEADATASKLVELHAGQTWMVRMIGFRPGFPYLGPVPAPLASVSRRSEPRIRVPAGAVALAAGQTGIYPSESPGGWKVIGITPLVIADPEEGWFPIRAGDAVRFAPIGEDEFLRLKGRRL